MLPHLHVAAAVLFNEKGEILIAKRPDHKSFPGFWEFPGGKLEEGESATQALSRELEEELRIKTREASLIPLLEIQYSYECQGFHLIMPTFLCGQWEGEIEPREHPEIAWITLDQVTLFQHLPTSLEIFKALEEKLFSLLSRDRVSPNPK